MRKLPYQSSLQFIQRPQLLWNDIGDRKLWRGIQWIRRGPTVPSRLSWNAYQSNIPKPRSGVRWKHGMRRFSEYGNVAFRIITPQISMFHTFFVGGLTFPLYSWHKRPDPYGMGLRCIRPRRRQRMSFQRHRRNRCIFPPGRWLIQEQKTQQGISAFHLRIFKGYNVGQLRDFLMGI